MNKLKNIGMFLFLIKFTANGSTSHEVINHSSYSKAIVHESPNINGSDMQISSTESHKDNQKRSREYMSKVFLQMSLNTAVSSFTCLIAKLIMDKAAITKANNPILLIVSLLSLLVASIIIYHYMTKKAKTFDKNNFNILFNMFAVVNGLILAICFISIRYQNIFIGTAAAAVVFGVFALWGLYTKKNLKSLKNIIFIVSIALIICLSFSLLLALFTGQAFGKLQIFICLLSIIISCGYVVYECNFIYNAFGKFEKIPRFSLEEKYRNDLIPILAFLLYQDMINMIADIVRLLDLAR
jgi:FtsH-binding integral membrane protein